MARIAVAVSGGADSLYALVSLQEQGHDVFALHGLFLPENVESPHSTQAIEGLEAICAKLHIPLHIANFRSEFDNLVVLPFITAYAEGRTPNPCALCNKQVKFGLLMDKALELRAELFATGHYADLQKADEDQSPLHKGQDLRKDQSYFLALVPRQRFSQVIFPLAKTQKTDNISYLQKRNISIPVAQESQEICFVPADAYRDFLLTEAKTRGIRLGLRGDIYVREGGEDTLLPKKFGGENGHKHLGLWQYTEGQRRGLGIAWKEPLYVCAKNCAANALIVAGKSEAILRSCTTGEVNFLVAPKLWPEQILVRLRYRQQELPATVSLEERKDGIKMHIHFATAQSPTAPGQIAAVYNANGGILAGGIIEEVS